MNCLKLHNTQYKKTMLALQQFVQKSTDSLVYHYGFLLNKLFSTQFFRKNPTTNEGFQLKLSKIMKLKKLKSFPEKFANLFLEVYQQIIVQNKNPYSNFFACLKSQGNKEEKQRQILEFMRIFYFLMEIGTRSQIQKEKKEALNNAFSNLTFLSSSKQLQTFVLLKLNKTEAFKEHTHIFDNVSIFKKPSQSQRTISSPGTQKLEKERQEEVPKMWEPELIQNKPKVEEDDICICWEFNDQNKLLVKEIFAFFHQVKKHLYQDNEIDFSGFFASFEQHLKVMQLELKKFEYMRKIIQFQS